MKNIYLGKSKLAFAPAKMEPKVLYKQSNLKKDFRTGEIRLMSVCFPEDGAGTSVNAEAKCLLNMDPLTITLGRKTWTLDGGGPSSHKETPARLCRCGFHAYNEYAPARDHDQQQNKGEFVLKVVGSGKMFEYKKGYRYGHQRVEEVIVSSCTDCHEPADRLVLVLVTGGILPLCPKHAVKPLNPHIRHQIISFSEFEEAASKGLPPNAPRITIHPERAGLVPWERPAPSPEPPAKTHITKRIPKKTPGWFSLENVGLALMCSPALLPLIMLVEYCNSALNQ